MDRLDQATCHSSKKWGFFWSLLLKFLKTGILPLSWSRYLCHSKGRLQEALNLPFRISSRKCMTLSFNGCRTQLGVKPSLSLSWAPQTRLELESLALFAPWMHDRCWIIIFFFQEHTAQLLTPIGDSINRDMLYVLRLLIKIVLLRKEKTNGPTLLPARHGSMAEMKIEFQISEAFLKEYFCNVFGFLPQIKEMNWNKTGELLMSNFFFRRSNMESGCLWMLIKFFFSRKS